MIKQKSISFIAIVLALLSFSCSSQKKQADTSTSLVAEGATLTTYADLNSCEGPATDADGNIYFAEVFVSRIKKWDCQTGEISLYRDNTGVSNGMMFDAQGNLVVCEMGNSRVVRDDLNGNITVLAESVNGESLVGPNDCWIAPNGGIYVSHNSMGGAMLANMTGGGAPGEEPGGDMPEGGGAPGGEMPEGGAPEGEMPEGGGAPGGGMMGGATTPNIGILYISPEGDVSLVTDDITGPNGLVGTPDGKTLYVGDGDVLYKYSINDDGSLSNKELFCEMRTDGMAMDEKGNVYLSNDNVLIYSPEGEFLEEIVMPEGCSNIEFGGKDGKTLFITQRTHVYTLAMNVKGTQLPIDNAK